MEVIIEGIMKKVNDDPEFKRGVKCIYYLCSKRKVGEKKSVSKSKQKNYRSV